MLKKIYPAASGTDPFSEGAAVYVVTTEGEILEGYTIRHRLLDLVSLDRSPLDGSDKQGFTIEGTTLQPNWCEGRKRIAVAVASRDLALELAARQKEAKAKKDKRS